MKSFMTTLAFLLTLCLIGTNGRHVDHNEYDDLSEAEDQTDMMSRIKDHATQSRHHRRSRQMHGYDYPAPFYYDNRRDYSIRQQEEYLSRIVKYLDEIATYLRRPPPPPPQPVYIPYPIVQHIPCRYRPISKPSQANETTEIPIFTDRFPVVEDENQLWGSPIEEIPEYVDREEDGSRPISFNPVEPSRPTSKPPPPVDHGSNQAGAETTTSAPTRRPGTCESAILTCCSIQERIAQRNCFGRHNCLKTYSTNRACDPAVIKRVIEHFSNAYKPVN